MFSGGEADVVGEGGAESGEGGAESGEADESGVVGLIPTALAKLSKKLAPPFLFLLVRIH